MASASTLERSVREAMEAARQPRADQAAARLIGERLAAKARQVQLESVHFQREHKQRYTGKLRALIEGARAGGLRVE